MPDPDFIFDVNMDGSVCDYFAWPEKNSNMVEESLQRRRDMIAAPAPNVPLLIDQ